MKPIDVIEKIRQNWGIGLSTTIDPAAKAAVEHLRKQMGNSLVLLSDQLYQNEAHYFLELLQNADDAHDGEYPPDHVPTVTLTVEPSRLVFSNNERGFAADDVRALCGVGESTKKGRKAVQIGEKGVGFKAVFQVSDQPEILSNGFHFRFNRVSYGDLGLVIPEWCGETVELPVQPGTTVILPAREGVSPGFDFGCLRPELLLFLRRLKRLVVHDQTSGLSVELRRDDDGQLVNVSRITRERGKEPTTETNRFFVHRRTVSMDQIVEKLRPEIRETEVVIALPMDADGAADERAQRSVFAFLPVTSAGLRFVCHADFVLMTNREGVLEGRPWNDRLRDELAVALADAMIAAQRFPVLGRTALRFLTTPASIPNEFYRPVLSVAIQRLKQASCVPVENSGWETPANTFQRGESGLSELVEADALACLLAHKYIDGANARMSLAWEILGCETFGVGTLVKCLKDKAWTASRQPKWFGRLYTLLSRRTLNSSESAGLRSSYVLRLRTGTVVTGGTPSVFQSLGRQTSYGFEEELSLLDPKVLSSVDKGATDSVRKLLTTWGVRRAEPVTIIDNHILPIHDSTDWSTRSAAALIGHVRYIRDHLEEYLKVKENPTVQAAALAKLGSTLHIQTGQKAKDKAFFNRPNVLYVANGFADPWRLRDLLGEAIDEHSISETYVKGDDRKASERDQEQWRQFFTRIGSHTLPRVNPVDGDWKPSPELRDLMQSQDCDRKALLLTLLDKNWNFYRGCLQHTFTVKRSARQTTSAFLQLVRAMLVRTDLGTTSELSKCYLKTEENLAVFGRGVPYLTGKWASEEFLESAEVVLIPSVEQAIQRLDALGTEDTLSVNQVKQEVSRLYNFLKSRWESHDAEIQQAFQHQQIVYITAKRDGAWARLEDCCWSIPRDLEAYAPVHGLHSSWPNMEEFFCTSLELRESLTAEEWVSTLEELAKDSDVKDSRVGKLALRIYRGLEIHCKEADPAGDMHKLGWVTRLRSKELIRTRRGEWWHNDDDVFIGDDSTLEEVFGAIESVAFLDVPKDDLPNVRSVIDLLRIPRLTDAVDVSPPLARNGQKEVELEERVMSRWRQLARYLWHKCSDTYKENMQTGQLKGLRTAVAYSYQPLEMDVKLCGHEFGRRFAVRCDLNESGVRYYVDAASLEEWDLIGIELGRVLGVPDTDGVNLGRILSAKSNEECDKFLSKLKIADLPDEERTRWGETVETEDESAHTVEARDEQETDSHAVVDPSAQIQGEVLAEVGASADGAPATRDVDNAVTGSKPQPDFDAQVVSPVGDPNGTERTAAPTDGSPQTTGSALGNGNVGLNRAKNTIQDGTFRPKTQSSQTASGDHAKPADGPDQDEACGNDDWRGSATKRQGDTSFDHRPSEGSKSEMVDVVPHKRGKPGAAGEDRIRSPFENAANWLRARVSPEIEEPLEAQDPNDREYYSDQEARDLVVRAETSRGWKAEPASAIQRGYDVVSKNPKTGERRFIEVKGVAATWDDDATVRLSRAQFDDGRKFVVENEDYWLYVVDRLSSDRPRVIAIRNPSQHGAWFYFQAQDWLREMIFIDEVDAPAALRPANVAPTTTPAQAAKAVPTPARIDGDTLAATDPLVHPLLARLGDLPLPTIQYSVFAEESELGVAELAWPLSRVAVLIPQQRYCEDAVQKAGWKTNVVELETNTTAILDWLKLVLST